MTRKEAIEILKNAAFLATTTSYQSIEEAVKMAVVALEQQEPCKDAVSRQAVYAVIEEVLYETTKGADNWYGLLNDGVRTLPSVTPKPEQRWIPCTDPTKLPKR